MTTDATGCIDSVDPGATGLVVSVGEMERLESTLSALAADVSTRQAMGVSARERILRDFDQRIVRDRVLDFIEHVAVTA